MNASESRLNCERLASLDQPVGGSHCERSPFFSTDEDLMQLKNSKGRHAQFLFDCTQFYKKWHIQSDSLHGMLATSLSRVEGIWMGSLESMRLD